MGLKLDRSTCERKQCFLSLSRPMRSPEVSPRLPRASGLHPKLQPVTRRSGRMDLLRPDGSPRTAPGGGRLTDVDALHFLPSGRWARTRPAPWPALFKAQPSSSVPSHKCIRLVTGAASPLSRQARRHLLYPLTVGAGGGGGGAFEAIMAELRRKAAPEATPRGWWT